MRLNPLAHLNLNRRMPIAQTTTIQRCIERLNANEPSARAELLQITHDRLLVLLRAQMSRYSRLRRWVQSDDVLQNVHVRLLRCFDDMAIASAREFLGLAATNMRRELIDLARHYYGAAGVGQNHATPAGDDGLSQSVDSEDPGRLLEWAELHECVAKLPEDEREVVDLHWYHDLTKKEVATLLGVSTKTVMRRWVAAKARIAIHLGPQRGFT
jgi:RNA polymerase sigma factor (sigma-70 family)